MQLTTVVFLDVMEYGTTDSYLGVGGEASFKLLLSQPWD